MAEQPTAPENVTPEQFFAELLPAGFLAQKESGIPTPQDFTIRYHLTGAGGGEWHVTIKDGKMATRKGGGEANLAFTLSVDDWRDAVLGRDGASLAVILPQARPGRPDNSARAKQLKGTMAVELAREGKDPMRVEMTFSDAATPRTGMKVKVADYVAMQEGRMNGQEAFMTGKIKIEGDMGFLMQIAALTA
ncbi:MAG TPA: SCP2 sterol-binding domain-containing protein [Candidatus Binatia bacterium]|nr:SCP2 sterol-binding domain-containing protein [Candidatus Binatia bacterium]